MSTHDATSNGAAIDVVAVQPLGWRFSVYVPPVVLVNVTVTTASPGRLESKYSVARAGIYAVMGNGAAGVGGVETVPVTEPDTAAVLFAGTL